MIDRSHALPVTRQARELGISRGSVYYLPRPTSDADLAIMRRLDELHMDFPFAGSRMLRDLLAADSVNRRQERHDQRQLLVRQIRPMASGTFLKICHSATNRLSTHPKLASRTSTPINLFSNNR